MQKTNRLSVDTKNSVLAQLAEVRQQKQVQDNGFWHTGSTMVSWTPKTRMGQNITGHVNTIATPTIQKKQVVKR